MPPKPTTNDEEDSLVRALDALSLKNKRLVKSTVHSAPADESVKIRSWKMDEFKYGVHPSPFPTLARGLFTRKVRGDGSATEDVDGEEEDENGEENKGKAKHVIVARGYDKFFNIGEVPWNSWPSIEKYTTGPYHLTLKSNGCIIFIAALSPTSIVVTSKHSLGPHQGSDVSHAMVGEKWLHRHLERKGKKVEQLAGRLWDEGVTAVAELCDDSFEEHVLAYPPELTGLHLHGLNNNTRHFSTAPPSAVDSFGEEFGFIKTAWITLETVEDVRRFTDEVGESGTWRGEAVEGFVVRCKITSSDDSAPEDEDEVDPGPKLKPKRGESSKSTATMHPPYPPGSDYFFKIKFDEPYLMYRAWREITKTILSARSKAGYDPAVPISIPKSRLARPESRLYREWVEREIVERPGDFEEFAKGKGIIETREKFLTWFATPEGQKRFDEIRSLDGSDTGATAGRGANAEAADVGERKEGFANREKGMGKLVIVPIAVPGCGKTAVAVALAHLFPSFAHTQSDDVKSKKTAPTFQRNITDLLKSHSVVIADRNNHLAQHRAGIRTAANAINSKNTPAGSTQVVRLVALSWSLNTLPLSTIHRLCSTRISARGENHQSLRPSPKISHEDVIWQFISSTEELGEGEVDASVEMDVAEPSLEGSVKRAVEGLIPLLNQWVEAPSGTEAWVVPTDEQIQEACDIARGYKVSVRKEDSAQRVVPARYHAFLPEINLSETVESALKSISDPATQSRAEAFFTALRVGNRLTRRPHITIVHNQELPNKQDLWDACNSLESLKLSPPLFEFELGTLVCDERVMSIAVDGLRLYRPSFSASGPTALEGDFDDRIAAEKRTADEAGAVLLNLLPEYLTRRFHITVGTSSEDIKPIEGGKLIERWKKGEKGITAIPLDGRTVIGRVRGLAG